MRNILARIASIVIIIAALAPCAAFAAPYEYYWFGGSDGSWTNTANWSSSPTEYVAVSRYPMNSYYGAHIDTSVASDHHVTIRVPKLASDPPQCAGFEFYDSTGNGTLTLVGEMDGDSRPSVPLLSNTKMLWTETGHPMRLEILNFNLSNGTLSIVENECPGCSVLVSNCVGTSTGNSYFMKLPGQHGGTMTIVDSEITTQILNATGVSDVAGYVFAVTNSTIAINNGASVGGPGTIVDIVNSNIRLGMYHPKFGADNINTTNDHQNMKISFKDTTINFNSKFVNFLSAGGTLLFDNVTQVGDCKDIALAGVSTTVKDTSFKFCAPNSNGGNGISGDLFLDNSEWVCTNSANLISTKLNGPLRVVFSGRAPRFGTSSFSGSFPVTFDFLVPKGGYAYAPVNRIDNAKTGAEFPSSADGGSINVLPESPAARVSGTLIQPLIYVKDVRNNKPVCNLKNLPLTTLPTEKSKFLVTTEYSWEYADVNGKQESDWTAVETGYNDMVAGVAVKIVGPKPGLSVFIR